MPLKLSKPLILIVTFCATGSGALGEVSEDRRALTRHECDLHGRFSELAMGLKQDGIPLNGALDFVRAKAEGKTLKTFETIIIDSYSFPSIAGVDATEEFKAFVIQNCFTRAEIEGRY